MNWYHNPYGYPPPPPSYGQPQYVPVPPNTDMDKVLKFVDRLTRREEAKKSKDKDKKDEKKGPSKAEQALKYAQWAGFLYITAPFFIILHHYSDILLTQALK